MTNEQIVHRFVEVMNQLDWDAVYAMMRDDVVYHNIPFPVLEGVEAVKGFFSAAGTISDCDWRIVNIAAQGDVVLTERIDEFKLNGRPVSLPVMGVFRIVDGKIAEWRDYFDARTFETQLGHPLG
jgi:limonene-1,2-epoxide hydrolase